LRFIYFPIQLLESKITKHIHLYLAKHNPEKLVRIIYRQRCNKILDLDNPQDLNEKINWLKVRTDTSIWTLLADKYKVRSYIENFGLGRILPLLYGKWDNANAIDFEKLPLTFVLKTNNASGTMIIVKDKSQLNIDEARKNLNKWLSVKNYGLLSAEFHYYNMKPCIIAEEYLEDQQTKHQSSSIIDYKFWCINGEPLYVWTCANRTSKGTEVAVLTLDWEYKPQHSVFNEVFRQAITIPQKPQSFDKMIEICKILSKGLPQVRVDLYEINGKPYFGELTFTSLGGYMNFYSSDFLLELGQKMILPV
jgi:hypothetical protein